MTLDELKLKLEKLINHLEWIKSTKEYNWTFRNNNAGPYAQLEHNEMMERYRKTSKKIKKLRNKIEIIEIIINELKK